MLPRHRSSRFHRGSSGRQCIDRAVNVLLVTQKFQKTVKMLQVHFERARWTDDRPLVIQKCRSSGRTKRLY